MRLSKLAALLSLILTLLIGYGCNKCERKGDFVDISGSKQYFTITYLTPNQVNYISNIYRTDSVLVWLNINPDENPLKFKEYTDSVDIANGKIGPIRWSVSPNRMVEGANYHYRYVIKKDTFGMDTIDLKVFSYGDECAIEWEQIDYIRNDSLYPEYQGVETANMVFIE